jgi:hypothetical protein
VSRQRLAKLSACAALAVVLLAGCGPFGGEDRSKLSVGEKQRVSLNLQDIDDFCRNREFGFSPVDILRDGVNGLIAVYRDNEADAIYDFGQPKTPMRSVLRTAAAKLEKCGQDGRRLGAAKLDRALEET